MGNIKFFMRNNFIYYCTKQKSLKIQSYIILYKNNSILLAQIALLTFIHMTVFHKICLRYKQAQLRSILNKIIDDSLLRKQKLLLDVDLNQYTHKKFNIAIFEQMADNNHTQAQIRQETELSNSRRAKGQPKLNRSNQATGGILLVILAGVFWIYGFAGEVRYANTANYPTTGLAGITNTANIQPVLGGIFIFSTVFVVIGFGLLLGYLKKAAFMGIFTAIFTVSITFIISPILQKFWFNVFMTDFHGASPSTIILETGVQRFWLYSLGGIDIFLDWVNLKIISANSIAQLLAFLVFHGKMNISQIIVNSVCFNVFWNLNLFLCAHLSTVSPDHRIFDDYQINSVYLFAFVYSSVVSRFFLPKPKTQEAINYSSSGHSGVIAHLGAFFLFLGFSSTTLLFSLKYTGSLEYARSYIWQEGILASFFAMSSGAIFNYVFSILLGGKIGIRGSIGGTIVGAVFWGPVSGTCVNIGAAIAVGLFAGLITALDYNLALVSENENQVSTSIGRIIIAPLATFVIAPIVIRALYNNQVELPTLYPSNSSTNRATIDNDSIAGWLLIYVAISIGIALAAGLLIGAFLKCLSRKKLRFFDDSELFKSGNYGLRNNANPLEQALPSAQALVK